MSLPISRATELTSSVPLVAVLHRGVQNPLPGYSRPPSRSPESTVGIYIIVFHREFQNPLSGYSSPPPRNPESTVEITSPPSEYSSPPSRSPESTVMIQQSSIEESRIHCRNYIAFPWRQISLGSTRRAPLRKWKWLLVGWHKQYSELGKQKEINKASSEYTSPWTSPLELLGSASRTYCPTLTESTT